MSLTEPTDSKWAAWFWLGVIILCVSAMVGGAVFVLHALWKGL